MRERGGVTSLVDVREAEQLVYGAGATIADLERRIAQQENLITVLIGGYPSAVTRGLELVAQPAPPAIPAGLPSALLARRPDIQQAEQQLVAANGPDRRGARRLLPHHLADWQRRPAEHGAAHAGHRRGRRLDAPRPASPSRSSPPDAPDRRSRWRRPAPTKRPSSTPTRSGRRFVKCPMPSSGCAKAGELRDQQERLATAAQDARRLADIRYRGGATSYLEVLDAETRLFDAEIRLAQAREAELQSFVDVYRALGAGWQQDGRPGAGPPSSP